MPALPQSAHAAAAPMPVRVGYPQPRGAQLPLWVTTEAKLDRKSGVDLQNIYISGGARLTQTLVAGDIDMATTGGAVINAVPSGADHPKAATAEPKGFFDNRFIKELEDTGFNKELYGQR